MEINPIERQVKTPKLTAGGLPQAPGYSRGRMRKIPEHLRPAFYHFVASVIEESQKWTPWTDEDIEAAVEMRQKGKSWDEIGKVLNRTAGAVKGMYYLVRRKTKYAG